MVEVLAVFDVRGLREELACLPVGFQVDAADEGVAEQEGIRLGSGTSISIR